MVRYVLTNLDQTHENFDKVATLYLAKDKDNTCQRK